MYKIVYVLFIKKRVRMKDIIVLCSWKNYQILVRQYLYCVQMQKQQKKVYLDLNHAFGSNFSLDAKNEIGIIEEDGHMKIIFTVGKAIVKQTIQSRAMEFIKLSDNVESIECIAISPTRNHIAVCQKIKNQNFLLLNLYGLKNRDSQIKHFKLPQTEKQSSFKIIAFSPSQPKYACCMTAEPDNQLMFLDISRSRGLAVSNFSVEGTQSISICPTQSHLISCAGRNIFKLFKVQDYSFKAYEQVKKLPKARNFTAHAWFDKTKILIGTDRGELFMIGPVGNNFEVKRHLGNVFTNQNVNVISQNLQNDLSLTAICVFSKGFIVGSGRGHFSLWMKREESQENFEDQYTGDLTKKWQTSQNFSSKVVSIAMCPQQQQIAIAFNSSTIATTTLNTLLHSQQVQSGGKVIEGDVLDYLYNGFHRHQISSMDICLQRPIFVTLSRKQNTIRLWNYKKPSCQLIKVFDSKTDGIEQLSPELINCLSLHPLGYYLAVGCCDKLRIYHILQNQLRNFREIVVRGVCCLRFANGGQFLAAAYPRQKNSAQKSSIHLINIYNSYTLEQVGRLNDHSSVITDLCWKFDDRTLYSVGADGTATEWKQGDPKAETKDWQGKKWTQPNSRYSSIIYQKQARSVLASGIESSKSVIRQFKIQKDQVQKLFAVGGFRVSKLAWLTSQWNIPAILAGTQDGYLKVFNSVFDNIVQQSLNVHRKQITGIVSSPCGRYVITASKDGIIFIYQVSLTNRQGFVNRKLHDQLNDYEINPLIGVLDDELSDIVLVQRNDLNQKNRYNKILEKNLEEMKRKLVMQEDDDSRRYGQQIQIMVKGKDNIIADLNGVYQKLKQEKKQLQINSQYSYVQMQNKNEKMLEDIEILYEKRLAIENKKYFELQTVFERQKDNQSKEKEGFRKKMQETLELLKKQFIECYKKAERIHCNQQHSIFQGQKQFNQKITQIEEEHEGELKKITEEIIHLQNQKNKTSIEYITNIESLKRECKILSDEVIRYMSENEMMVKKEDQFKEQLSEINKKIVQKREDLLSKQEALKAREEKISQYQDRITDLQKKKEVLSYRTWEMRQQIEPKEDQIQFLKQQIYNIQKEFQKLLDDEKVIQQTQLKLKRSKQLLTKQLGEQKQMTKEKKLKINKICDDIQSVVQSKNTDKKYYQTEMKSLYDRYNKFMSENKRNNQNPRGIDQIERHIGHIDNQISEVNQKTDQTIKKRDQEIRKTTQQNADLIKELTQSREERTKLTQELKNVQKIADNLSRQTKQIKNINVTQSRGIEQPLGKKMPGQLKPLPNISSLNLIRSNSQPMIKGKVSRGVNYDQGSLSIFTKAKLKDLQNKLQMAKLNLRQRQIYGRLVKQKIEEHVKREECNDIQLRKIIEEYDI